MCVCVYVCYNTYQSVCNVTLSQESTRVDASSLSNYDVSLSEGSAKQTHSSRRRLLSCCVFELRQVCRIISVDSSNFQTIVKTESNQVYWTLRILNYRLEFEELIKLTWLI